MCLYANTPTKAPTKIAIDKDKQASKPFETAIIKTPKNVQFNIETPNLSNLFKNGIYWNKRYARYVTSAGTIQKHNKKNRNWFKELTNVKFLSYKQSSA